VAVDQLLKNFYLVDAFSEGKIQRKTKCEGMGLVPKTPQYTSQFPISKADPLLSVIHNDYIIISVLT